MQSEVQSRRAGWGFEGPLKSTKGRGQLWCQDAGKANPPGPAPAKRESSEEKKAELGMLRPPQRPSPSPSAALRLLVLGKGAWQPPPARSLGLDSSTAVCSLPQAQAGPSFFPLHPARLTRSCSLLAQSAASGRGLSGRGRDRLPRRPCGWASG